MTEHSRKFQMLRWFVNKTGMVDNPNGQPKSLLWYGFFIVGLTLWVGAFFVEPAWVSATAMFGLVLLMMVAMLIWLLQFLLDHNTTIRTKLDTSQARLSDF